MIKAYRFRICPNSTQKTMFAKTFCCVRFVYNKMFGDTIECYKEHKKMLKNTPAGYKKEFDKYHDMYTNAAINIRNEGMRVVNALV